MYYWTGQLEQRYDITFSDADLASAKWHQVSIYMLDWGSHPKWVSVEVLDAATEAVLDSRQPMDYNGGKWLSWNVRGNVKIRLKYGLGYKPNLSGLFFDPVRVRAE